LVTTVQKLATPEPAYSGAVLRDFRHCPRSTVGESSTNRTLSRETSGHERFSICSSIGADYRSPPECSLSFLINSSWDAPLSYPIERAFYGASGWLSFHPVDRCIEGGSFGEGVQRTIRLLRYFRHVIFLSQTLPLSHRLAFFFLCRPFSPNRIIGPCAWLPSPVLRRRQYIWGRPDWCASA